MINKFVWMDHHGAFVPAQKALEHGWKHPALQRVMAGEKADEWKEAEPVECTLKRIQILRKDGKIQESLNLALATGQKPESAQLLCAVDRYEEAVDVALHNAKDASTMLMVAQNLREKYPTGSFIVAMEAYRLAKAAHEESTQELSENFLSATPNRQIKPATVIREMAGMYLIRDVTKRKHPSGVFFASLLDLCLQKIAQVLLEPDKDIRELREFFSQSPEHIGIFLVPEMTLHLCWKSLDEGTAILEIADELSNTNQFAAFRMYLRYFISSSTYSYTSFTSERLFSLAMELGSYAMTTLVNAISEAKVMGGTVPIKWSMALLEMEMPSHAYELAKASIATRYGTDLKDIEWFLTSIANPLGKASDVIRFFSSLNQPMKPEVALHIGHYAEQQLGVKEAYEFLKGYLEQFRSRENPFETAVAKFVRLAADLGSDTLREAAVKVMEYEEGIVFECIRSLSERHWGSAHYLASMWVDSVSKKQTEEYIHRFFERPFGGSKRADIARFVLELKGPNDAKDDEMELENEEENRLKRVASSVLFMEEPTVDNYRLVQKMWEHNKEWTHEKQRLLEIAAKPHKDFYLLSRVQILLEEG